MSTKRLSYILIAILVLLSLSFIGLAVMGNVFFQKQSDKLSSIKAQEKVAREQEIALIQAKRDIEKYTALDNIAKSIVPQDKDQAKTVREIYAIASQSGIRLQQINFSSSNLGQAAPKSSAPKDEGASNESTKTTPAQPAISQVKPVEGIKGVYALEITITSGEGNNVPYYKFLSFLQRLESNRRTAHVSKISITPDDNGNVKFSLTLNAYLKP